MVNCSQPFTFVAQPGNVEPETASPESIVSGKGKRLEAHTPYLIDEILPTKEVHLIGGPSGAGKSTWLLQMMDSWRKGEPILGHKSHPLPFVYISADRSQLSVERVFKRLDLDLKDFPVETMETLTATSLIEIIKTTLSRTPKTRVFFIEGFQTFCTNMNNYSEVAKFLRELVRFCVKHNITIIGVCHATKTKKDEGYDNPRQKINGSVAWAAYSETIIYIEPVEAADPNNKSRSIAILPRNSAEQMHKMEFKDGRLVPYQKPLPAPQRFDAWIMAKGPNARFTTSEGIRDLSMASSTFHAELARAVKCRMIESVEMGVYRTAALEDKADA